MLLFPSLAPLRHENMDNNLEFENKTVFQPSALAQKVLVDGKILAEGESPDEMFERMTKTLFLPEAKFGTPEEEIRQLESQFFEFCINKYCVMSTPVMTNAGRYLDKPLSACTVPPVDLRGDLSLVKKMVDTFHAEGMGTGFSLNDVENPIEILKFLNRVAVEGANSGREDRPVGNMATLTVHHPSIIDFISIKTGADDRGEDWKFNISVDASEDFMNAVIQNKTYRLNDGKELNAREIMFLIAENAQLCADPGLIFIDRLNRDNPTPGVGAYVSTAPCAEVGLTPGESCQFGYINLGKFVQNDGMINFSELEILTKLMTRVLDNALELSIDNYSIPTNQNVMRAKRKIGVGICGLADLFVQLKMPYDSPDARNLAKEIVTFVNYVSKVESHELAKKRGAFFAMNMPIGCRYNEEPSFLENKYGEHETTMVTSQMWRSLGEKIRKTGLLRNASTIALPPTGRSSLVIDASTGIEPIFSLSEFGGGINKFLKDDLEKLGLLTPEIERKIALSGKVSGINEIPADLKAVYKTALEIKPDGHLSMIGEILPAVDESISKTVNVPEYATSQDILALYIKAHQMGLKGITIFRTGSRKIQPKKLAIL